MPIDIRPLNRHDMLSIQSLRTAASMDGTLGDQRERERGLTLEQIEQQLQMPFVTFGAFIDARLSGVASISLMPDNPLDPDGQNWYALSGVLVADQQRGQGIGRKLVEKSLSYAIEHGADGILLEVNVPNLAAKFLYESLGFEVWNVLENAYKYKDVSFNQVSMRKRVTT
jgi:ribosomal protein S18 acetylase RimI-like enzyme